MSLHNYVPREDVPSYLPLSGLMCLEFTLCLVVLFVLFSFHHHLFFVSFAVKKVAFSQRQCRAQEPCESQGGIKDSLSLIVRTASVYVKQN